MDLQEPSGFAAVGFRQLEDEVRGTGASGRLSRNVFVNWGTHLHLFHGNILLACIGKDRYGVGSCPACSHPQQEGPLEK